MKQKTAAKIMAFLALFWIVIGIIGTSLTFLLSSRFVSTNTSDTLTQEEINTLIEEFGASGSTLLETGSWFIVEDIQE